MPRCCWQYLFTVKWTVFGPVDLAQSENFIFIRGIWRKRTADTLPVVVGRSNCRWDTLAYLQNLYHPQSCCCSGPLLHNTRWPKQVQISSLGTGTQLSYAHSSQTTDWGTNIHSVLLLRIWNGWSHSETPYTRISALYGSMFYRSVPLFLQISLQLKL